MLKTANALTLAGMIVHFTITLLTQHVVNEDGRLSNWGQFEESFEPSRSLSVPTDKLSVFFPSI